MHLRALAENTLWGVCVCVCVFVCVCSYPTATPSLTAGDGCVCSGVCTHTDTLKVRDTHTHTRRV